MTGDDDSAGDGNDAGFCEYLIAFRSSLLASATHEFQNHLAVVKEYNGLMRDLLSAHKPDKKTARRCVDISGSIEERVRQAATSVDSLNHFAHRGDTAISRFKVGDVVKELVSMLGRDLSQKKVILEVEPAGGGPEIVNNPVLLQCLVFTLVKPLIENVGSDGRILIWIDTVAGNVAQIVITAEPVNPIAAPSPEKLYVIESCMDMLGVTVSTMPAASGRLEYMFQVSSISTA